MEGIFSKTLTPPLWKFQLSFIHFFKFFGLTEPPKPPPPPQEIPIPSVGGVWIFSGTAQFTPKPHLQYLFGLDIGGIFLHFSLVSFGCHYFSFMQV